MYEQYEQYEQKVYFSSGKLKLEGFLSFPELEKREVRFPGVVVCHPHPQHGGNMDNNVVIEVCESLNEMGIAALRFNYRGVNGSEGEYSEGSGEQEDAKAAISFLRSCKAILAGKIGVCGYSFGSIVGIPAAVESKKVQAVASISPPELSALVALNNYAGPKFVVCGSGDEFIKPAELRKMVDKLPEPKKLLEVPGADHFWSGFEIMLSTQVACFFVDSFQTGVG